VAVEKVNPYPRGMKMKKKFNDKLALNRETLRNLNGLDMSNVKGAVYTDGTCGTGQSNVTDTCETCIGPSCRYYAGTSICC
jgi:hypothetical protein